ncbi:hypothetical protein [Streptomyces sp. NPDC002845]
MTSYSDHVPVTREAAFHDRARHIASVNYRITVATTTLQQLTWQGLDQPMWRVADAGEDRRSLAALPKARWARSPPRPGPPPLPALRLGR